MAIRLTSFTILGNYAILFNPAPFCVYYGLSQMLPALSSDLDDWPVTPSTTIHFQETTEKVETFNKKFIPVNANN